MELINISLSHRIYCNERFVDLVDLLRGYLEANKYKSDAAGKYEVVNHKHFEFIRNDADYPSSRSTIMVSVCRSVSLQYGEIIFKVGNLRNEEAKGNLKFSDLPLGVRQRFSVMPNFIEITNYHPAWYKHQKILSKNICDWFGSRNKQIYVSTLSNEYLDLLSSAYKEPQRIAVELHKLISSICTNKNAPLLDISRYPDDFHLIIPELTRDSMLAIKTAELIETQVENLPDYSAVIIEYCKAVEIEVEDKILGPLKDYWLSIGRPAIPASNRIKTLERYLFSNSDKKLELGTFAAQLENALKCTGDPIATSLIKSVKELPLTIDANNLIDSLFFVTRSYRNPAAHKAILTKDELKKCKGFIIGDNMKLGLLQKIISTS